MIYIESVGWTKFVEVCSFRRNFCIIFYHVLFIPAYGYWVWLLLSVLKLYVCMLQLSLLFEVCASVVVTSFSWLLYFVFGLLWCLGSSLYYSLEELLTYVLWLYIIYLNSSCSWFSFWLCVVCLHAPFRLMTSLSFTHCWLGLVISDRHFGHFCYVSILYCLVFI